MSLPPLDWPAEALDMAREEVNPVAWEDPDRPGPLALLITLAEVLRQPKRFFAGLPLTGGLGEPLGFALLIGTTGVLSSLLWQLILDGGFSETLPGVFLQYLGNVMHDPRVIAGIFLLTPLLVVLGQFFLSLCLLWAVRLTGGNLVFEGVFRLAAYAQAPAVFCLFPWGGAFIAGIWNLVLLVRGLAVKGGFSTVRAAFTLLLATIFQGVLFLLLLLLSGVLGLWGLLFSGG